MWGGDGKLQAEMIGPPNPQLSELPDGSITVYSVSSPPGEPHQLSDTIHTAPPKLTGLDVWPAHRFWDGRGNGSLVTFH